MLKNIGLKSQSSIINENQFKQDNNAEKESESGRSMERAKKVAIKPSVFTSLIVRNSSILAASSTSAI